MSFACLGIRGVFSIQRKSLVNNTIWNTAGLIVYHACQWLISVVAVWIYGNFTNAGLLGLAMGITNIFAGIATYNIRAYQISDVHNEHSDSVYIATRFVTVAGAAAMCAAFLLISGYPAEQIYIILCYMGFRCVEALIDVLHGIVHKRGRLDIAGISMIVRGVLMLTVFSILGRFFDLLPVIIAMTAVTALVGIAFDIPKARKFAVLTDKLRSGFTDIMSSVWVVLKRCFPLMLALLMITFYASYTKFSLERVVGTEEFGGFTSATTPAVALQLITSFMLAPQMNLFSDSIKRADKLKFRRVFIISLALIGALTIAAVLASYLLGPWALRILYGTAISPYSYLLTWAMVATGFTSLLWLMNVVFSSLRDIKGLFFGCLTGVVTCVIATHYLILLYGLNGANYAMIVSQLVVFVVLCLRLIFRKIQNEHTSSVLL